MMIFILMKCNYMEYCIMNIMFFPSLYAKLIS
eukprot:UN10057